MYQTSEEGRTPATAADAPTRIPAREPYPNEMEVERSWRRAPAYQEDSRHKSPGLAAFFSLMPGLGQVYVGYYQQGFINVLAAASMITLITMKIRGIMPLLPIFLAFFWMYNIVDAARRASFYNRSLDGLGPVTLPEDAGFSGTKGSLLGGALLSVFGLIMLLHTRFGMSLDWLEEWWPVALLGVGGYLIYLHFKERQKSA